MLAQLLFSLLGLFGFAGAAGLGSSSNAVSSPPPSKFKPNTGVEDRKVQEDTTSDQPLAEPVDETPVNHHDPVPNYEPTEPTPTTGEQPVNSSGGDTAPVDETPVSDVDPAPNYQPNDPTPTTGEQQVNSSGGESAPVDVSSSFSVPGGRVTTLQVSNHENVDSIRILEGPSHGNLTVNPDNTMALVMSYEPNFAGRIGFTYEVTYADSSTQVHSSSVDVQLATQQAGWAEGNFYMFETDENGDVVVEFGDNHREVYISGSLNALTLSDIAALEGLSTSQITTSWMQEHAEYGGSPEMALDSEAGMQLWYGITGVGTEPSSNWLLFERGYEYDDLGRVIESGTLGEDPMHPIHITSYGEGDKPILNARVSLRNEMSENIVISDVKITGGVSVLSSGKNLIFDNVDVTNDGSWGGNMGLHLREVDGATLHNSSITDVHIAQAPSGAYWAGNEMASGMLIGGSTGVLIEGSLFDHNGWEDDYRFNLSTNGGLPPSIFSHNVYIDNNNIDVTFRDNITMQAASYGAHIRSGGFIEDNVFLDNNAAIDFMGGNYYDAGFIGHFTLFADNLITSAGYLETERTTGLSMGMANGGMDNTLLDNIIAHLADPNNPDEIAEKEVTRLPLKILEDPLYDDTIIYNWQGSGSSLPSGKYDQNIDGLNTSTLNATTIQRFTQQLLGDPNAGIPELADFLRAQAEGSLDHYVDADLIIDFFQTGFGLNVTDRLFADELHFVPNELGDGIRWDNRINWSTEDLPGTVAGDSVDLGGNWVIFGGMTTTIDNLDLGESGRLNVSSGRLNVEGQVESGGNGGAINVSNVGQIWMNGYSDTDQLNLNVSGGRFANTGDFGGNTQATFTDGQAILATGGAKYDIGASSALHIDGSESRVGFDGNTGETAVMRLLENGTLRFSADSEGFGEISEFRSGALGDAPNVASGVNLGLGTLELDLGGLSDAIGSFSLISVDEMIGEFTDIRVIGLAGNRDAELVVDYRSDTLTLNITGGGNGQLSVNQIGDQTDMDHTDASAIWAALTAGQGIEIDNLPTDVEANGNNVELEEMLV